MKSARPLLTETSAPQPAHDTTRGAATDALVRFTGTGNPRHLRALAALLRRPVPREHLDREAGCSNAPQLIYELRERGLEVPCERAPVIDRDGREVYRGVYTLSLTDRRCISRWLRRREVRCSHDRLGTGAVRPSCRLQMEDRRKWLRLSTACFYFVGDGRLPPHMDRHLK